MSIIRWVSKPYRGKQIQEPWNARIAVYTTLFLAMTLGAWLLARHDLFLAEEPLTQGRRYVHAVVVYYVAPAIVFLVLASLLMGILMGIIGNRRP